MSMFNNIEALANGANTDTLTLNDYMSRLNNLFKKKSDDFLLLLEKAEALIAQSNSKEAAAGIYELAGDFYHSQDQVDMSILYYLMAFECINKLKMDSFTVVLVNKICRSYYKMNKFQHALYYINFVLAFGETITKDDFIKLTFNCALCYKSMGTYDKALAQLLKLDNLVDKNDKNRLFDLAILETNCFINLKLYPQAIERYLKLQDIIRDDAEKQFIILLNLSRAYIYAGEDDKAQDCISCVKTSLKNTVSQIPYKLKAYKELGQLYLELNNLTEAQKYLMLAYRITKQNKNIEIQKEILSLLFELCSKFQSPFLIKFVKEQMLSILSSGYENTNWTLLFKLLDLYNRMGKIHEVNDILTVILSIK